MKKLLLVLLASASLLAANQGFAFLDDLGEVKVDLESWCEGDSVKAYDEDGSAYTVYDCYEASRRCVETKRSTPNDIVEISATCK